MAECDPVVTLHCSFCSKHFSEVKKLVRGKNALICDECVDAAVGTLLSEGFGLPWPLRENEPSVLARVVLARCPPNEEESARDWFRSLIESWRELITEEFLKSKKTLETRKAAVDERIAALKAEIAGLQEESRVLAVDIQKLPNV